MKTARLIAFALVLLTLGLAGCATTQHHDTESQLSAAGFHALTPSTPQQQAVYASLPPYRIERAEINGKMVYAYAATRSGILYVGGPEQYQRYKQLAYQQKIATEQLEAAEMNENAITNWSYWGPAGMWW